GCPDVVGAAPASAASVSDRGRLRDNLQRIVSRCRCDIRYASYTARRSQRDGATCQINRCRRPRIRQRRTSTALLKEAASPTRRGDELLRDLEARAAPRQGEDPGSVRVCCAAHQRLPGVARLGRHGRRNQSKQERMIRRNEICFEDATCVLTKEAGQLDFAKVIFKRFSVHTRTFKADYSGARITSKLGYLQVQDTANGCVDVVSPTALAPAAALCPTALAATRRPPEEAPTRRHLRQRQQRRQRRQLRTQRADSQQQPFLRVDCVELPPITGISVKQSLEVQIDRLKLN
uniref:Apt1 domain-containing protein n=1 Tax=Macrostomum lignano TaxID=282301 RepID=A0A1I8FC43_9PLAT